MSFPSAPSSATSCDDWTFVTRRRRRQQIRDRVVESADRTAYVAEFLDGGDPSPPSPWAPCDSSIDDDLLLKLARRIDSAVRRLDASPFYRRAILRLREQEIHARLQKILSASPGSSLNMVIYGIGSIGSSENSILQLSLALLLRSELGIGRIEVFDPVLSGTECASLLSLGIEMVAVNERGRREASEPTLFYMPHCDEVLYDNLLGANWRPPALRRMVVLGNSFQKYLWQAEWSVKCGRFVKPGKGVARRLLAAAKHSVEVALVEGVEKDMDRAMEYAFHDISWHFFELDDDADMEIILAS